MRRFLKRLAIVLFGRSSSHSFPRIWILLFDCVLVLLAYIMIMGIQWYAIPNTMTAQAIAEQSLSVFLAFLLAFLLTKSYNGMLRYSGFRDILRISGACLLAMAFLFVGKFIVTQVRIEALSFFPSYYKVFAITFMAMLMLTISRLVIRRIYNEYFRKTTKTVNVIIYGAGDAGPITQNALAQDTSCQYNIISFVDDAKQKIGKSINGTLVRSAAEVLNHEFINKYGVTTMIIAIPSLTRAQHSAK